MFTKMFPGDLSWDTATLASAWIVGPLYGMNICVYILCFHVLHVKGLRGLNLMMFLVSSVQFSLATGHVITRVVQLIRAFIGSPGTLDGPSQYQLSQSTPEHMAEVVLYITNSLIGDAILIWRLWIIWGRKLWLCIPFIVLGTATGVTGYTALVHLARLTSAETVFQSRVHNWLIATWVFSLATQLGATLLIGYQFWKSMRWNTKEIRGSRLSVLWILVESGALYSITTVFLIGFSSTNIGAIFAASLGQISALAPTLIIVRIGLKNAGPNSSWTPAKGSINNAYYPSPPPRPIIRDVESGLSEDDDTMVLHIRKATEIRLGDTKPRVIVELSSIEERSSSATPD